MSTFPITPTYRFYRSLSFIMLKKYLLFIQFFLLVYDTLVGGENWHVRELFLRSVDPKYVTVPEKSAVNIYCGSSSPVNWTYTQSGLHPAISEVSITVHSRHLIGYKTIILIHLLQKDSGDYCCLGKDRNVYFRVCSLVSVVKSVPLGSVIPSLAEVLEGGSVTLQCGSEYPVEWFSLQYQNQNKTVQNNFLTLYNLRKEHSGPYLCRGTKLTITQIPFISQARLIQFHQTALIFVGSTVKRIYPGTISDQVTINSTSRALLDEHGRLPRPS